MIEGKIYNAGDKILAKLYSLDQEYHECTYVREVSKEECDLGYRYGYRVEYDGREYWVLPGDTDYLNES